MADSELRSVTWYIEARADGFPGQPAQMGSAVVVWLKKKSDGTTKKYLLTCGHVLRAPAADGTVGYGVPLTDILVWPPLKGFTKPSDIPNRTSNAAVPGSFPARVSELTPPQPGEIPTAQRLAATDWILLDVVDPGFQQVPSVPDWSGESGQQLTVVGYPGGSLTWRTGDVITPTISRLFEVHSQAAPGIWTLTGPAETRAGMSGGGVFNEQGQLFGLHRSRQDLQMAGQAITATHIQAELNARGYEVVPFLVTEEPTPPTVAELRWQYLNLTLAVALVLLATVWSYRVLDLFAVSLIWTGISAAGVGGSIGFFFPKLGFSERIRQFLGRLRHGRTAVALAILYVIGGLMSLTGTIIDVAALPDGVKQVRIEWGAVNQTSQLDLSINQPKWFWTLPPGTTVQFISPGFVTVPKNVTPWTQTRFHGADELRHRPFVVVQASEAALKFAPEYGEKAAGFRWKLRVTSRSVKDSTAPAEIWTAEDSYEVRDPIWLGGDGKNWPTVDELPVALKNKEIFKPTNSYKLTTENDYTIELLDQHGQPQAQAQLVHQQVIDIREPRVVTLSPK